MMIPPGALKIDTYYPEEWTRIAAGLAPNAGNAECDSCGSDYFLEGSKITLLTYDRDPFGVAERLAGRLVDVETMRWLAVGKESPQPGRVCNECQAEFDLEGDRLRLVSCNNSRLLDRSSTAFSVEDWLRIGQDLPTVEEETQFEVDFDEALRNAYVGGQVGPDFPRRRDLIWAGPATLDDAPQGAFASDRAENRLRSGTLTLTTTEATFGGVFNRWKRTLDEIAGVSSEGDWIRLQFDGDAAVEFEVGALEMTCRLESGARKVNLTANDLMRRLRFEIDRAAVEV